jgi:uncharacterized protein YggE
MRTPTLVSLAAALLIIPIASLAQPERPPAPIPPPQPQPGGDEPRDRRMPPLISVSGRAEVGVKPDLAVLRLGATAQADSAAEAHGRVSQIMSAAIENIRALDVPEESISTSSLTMYPVYSQPGPREVNFEPRIVGYRASNTIRIELTDLQAVGAVTDAAVGSGASRASPSSCATTPPPASASSARPSRRPAPRPRRSPRRSTSASRACTRPPRRTSASSTRR